MSVPLMLLPLLVMAAQTQEPASGPVVVTGYAWAPFISPMGEPFRYRARGEDTLANWFRLADHNHDGMLTAEEMQGDADRFFARLDTNRDRQIDPDEIVRYEWEVAPEIQVMSKRRRGRDEPRAEVRRPENRPDGELDDLTPAMAGDGLERGLQGAARYALLNIPQPVAAADADFNRLVSSIEFRQAATVRFGLLDTRQQGHVTMEDLRALLPRHPVPRPDRNAADTRFGNPLPPRN